jgi:Ser/Thr protein kinase RdoA (MazF antagonist)
MSPAILTDYVQQIGNQSTFSITDAPIQSVYSATRIGEYVAMHSPLTAHSAVSEEPPDIDIVEVTRVVKQHFGLEGDYSRLISERDQNFHLHATDGSRYVVKVTSAAQALIVSEFQIEALLHLERAATVRVPRVIRTTDGRTMGRIDHGKKRFALRVVNYLDGEKLASTHIDADMAQDFGGALANLDTRLAGFSHEGERPVLLWDLQRAAELRDLFHFVDDPSMRDSVSRSVDDFERVVSPALDALRSQVIHGDANPDNVLVDPKSRRVSGFIDFGDMVHAPLIFEVAIAASYLRAEETNPLVLIAPFVAGYHAAQPLLEAEIALLFDLVRARLATTVTLLCWRLGARHDEDSYRQKTLQQEAGAYSFLQVLDGLGKAGFLRLLAPSLQH